MSKAFNLVNVTKMCQNYHTFLSWQRLCDLITLSDMSYISQNPTNSSLMGTKNVENLFSLSYVQTLEELGGGDCWDKSTLIKPKSSTLWCCFRESNVCESIAEHFLVFQSNLKTSSIYFGAKWSIDALAHLLVFQNQQNSCFTICKGFCWDL